MANPLMSMFNPTKANISPEMKQQIKSLYQLYKGNPTNFINNAMSTMPALKNNPILSSVLNGGGNAQKTFNQLLNQSGMSEQEFKELLS